MRPYRAEAIERHRLFLLRLLLSEVNEVLLLLPLFVFMKAPPPLFGHALHLGQHDRTERMAPLRGLTQIGDRIPWPVLPEVAIQKRARVVVRDDVRLPLDDKTEDPVKVPTNWA